IAIGITAAPVERLAALRAPLHHFALRAIRTSHANRFLFDELAGRVVAAGRKLAESPLLQQQIVAALRALLVQRHIRLFLLSGPDALRRLAIRISRTRVERPEAALLQHHGPA